MYPMITMITSLDTKPYYLQPLYLSHVGKFSSKSQTLQTYKPAARWHLQPEPDNEKTRQFAQQQQQVRGESPLVDQDISWFRSCSVELKHSFMPTSIRPARVCNFDNPDEHQCTWGGGGQVSLPMSVVLWFVLGSQTPSRDEKVLASSDPSDSWPMPHHVMFKNLVKRDRGRHAIRKLGPNIYISGCRFQPATIT